MDNGAEPKKMIDPELKHELINKLCARGAWAQRVRNAIRKGFYKQAQDELTWVVKSSTEALDLLRKEEHGHSEIEVNADKA